MRPLSVALTAGEAGGPSLLARPDFCLARATRATDRCSITALEDRRSRGLPRSTRANRSELRDRLDTILQVSDGILRDGEAELLEDQLIRRGLRAV